MSGNQSMKVMCMGGSEPLRQCEKMAASRRMKNESENCGITLAHTLRLHDVSIVKEL